ncbi:hypothetical protein S14_37 [Shewanella sp. phage 1/4]|uniref:hypothetical protein n=1 Tax=Shewanella phage 1/4 TaxID=1458859 RepID=UPI0004F83711|nr:hypothetical protein S14_37 [Shewanella sp. phage 1/4]AHK11149.1 hypothetical protein S14_37 [Shewanella sp. phage 1/4]
MTISKIKPPKDGEVFLALVDHAQPYWDIFFWATKEDGVDKDCYVDRSWFEMPPIIKWQLLPSTGM